MMRRGGRHATRAVAQNTARASASLRPLGAALAANAQISQQQRRGIADSFPSVTPLGAGLRSHQRYALDTHKLPDQLANMSRRVLNDSNMAEVLDPDLFARYVSARNSPNQLSTADKDHIAAAVRAWAQEQGCVSYTHWFFPMRGVTAGDKIETFLGMDKSFRFQAGFTGSSLFQTETDGSSFPNGGLRDTHRAGAYIVWDTSSPLFIYDGVLHIPSAFVSWTGEALDIKTPLLRSQDALNREGVKFLRHLGDDKSERLVTYIGWEQEFFLVDRDLYQQRPDLQACGRALFGATPLNGQENSDNYFATMPVRVRAVLNEVRDELWEMGVSIDVMHNEVAPGQHEITPIFSLSEEAADSNILAMKVLEEVSERHGLAVLFHEKPFKGINGSGKHNNLSYQTTNTKYNLCAPGKDVDSQRRFAAFMAAFARAVHVHGDVLRMGISSAGNDHRLGAQEAPPAILTLYLGEHLELFLRQASEGGPLTGYGDEDRIVTVTDDFEPVHATPEDRNRTAPFPWVGNRFEFRAVGSHQNVAWPQAMMNTIMADSMAHMSQLIEADNGQDADDVIRSTLRAHAGVLFHGDGYDADLVHKLAREHDLFDLKTSPEAFDQFGAEKNIRLFERFGIMTEAEVRARQEVARDTFNTTIAIEARTTLHMLRTGIIPAVVDDIDSEGRVPMRNRGLDKKKELLQDLLDATEELSDVVDAIPDDIREAATYMVEAVRPRMEAARAVSDKLEERVSQHKWPFPYVSELVYSHH
jgi:glutamine synthetase